MNHNAFAEYGTAFPEGSVKEMKEALGWWVQSLSRAKYSGATPPHCCIYKDGDRRPTVSPSFDS